MKKIGPLLAIISGAITVILAIWGLLIAQNILKQMDFIGKYISEADNLASKANTGASIIFGILIASGVIQALLGAFAMFKPRGVSSFILLLIFVATTTLSIMAGVKAESWPTSTIVLLVINGASAIGLALGFVGGNK